MSTKFERGQLLGGIVIERMSYGPDAVAHSPEGKTLFVRGGVPGDVVSVVIDEDKASFARAHVHELEEAGEARIEPAVELTGLADAAPWALIARAKQLSYKHELICDALRRSAGFSDEQIAALVGPIHNPGPDWGWRNKLELGVVKNGVKTILGMQEQGELVSLNSCAMLPQRFAKLPHAIAGAISFLQGNDELGIQRVGLRCSERTGDLELALWTSPTAFPRTRAAKILSDATKARSVVRVISSGEQKARKVKRVERLAGTGSWSEKLGSNTMRVSAPSFFQVNTRGAEKLIELVLEFLDPQEGEWACDLYCGAGTFTLPLAQHCDFVSAVEISGPAVRDLTRNLELAGLANVEVTGGDAGREFAGHEADLIVVDPPRAGLSRKLIELLCASQARAIVYVSCDPQTLARDLATFVQLGSFVPTRLEIVDLFPQTFHVECVCLLSRETR